MTLTRAGQPLWQHQQLHYARAAAGAPASKGGGGGKGGGEVFCGDG